MSARGKAAIVGAAESDLGAVGPGFTPLDLIGQATERVLTDAGLEKKDIDGLFSASVYYHMSTLAVGEYLGIRPRFSDVTMMGGSSFVPHLLHAAAAIEAGLCEVALVAYASTQLSEGGFRGVSDPPNLFETPYRPRYPVSMYALAASRHMYEYGTTREQLAEVAVAARQAIFAPFVSSLGSVSSPWEPPPHEGRKIMISTTSVALCVALPFLSDLLLRAQFNGGRSRVGPPKCGCTLARLRTNPFSEYLWQAERARRDGRRSRLWAGSAGRAGLAPRPDARMLAGLRARWTR